MRLLVGGVFGLVGVWLWLWFACVLCLVVLSVVVFVSYCLCGVVLLRFVCCLSWFGAVLC